MPFRPLVARLVLVTLPIFGVGASLAQVPPEAPAAPSEELVGPPLPTHLGGPPAWGAQPIDPPPRIEGGIPAPDPSDYFTTDLEDLLGRVTKEYIVPSPGTIVKSIFGFIVLLALAFIAGHPTVAQIERRLGIAHLATTGLPFLLLGLFAAQPRVGVLSPAVMREITPLLTFGLGWIGFGVGYRFNSGVTRNLPPGASSVVGYTTLLPFFAVTAVCGVLMFYMEGVSPDRDFLRDAILLGAAGAMAARSSPFLWKEAGLDAEDLERMSRLVEVERIVGVLGLMAVSAYFRPEVATVAWQIPGTAWLFVSFGVGGVLGSVVLAVLSVARKPAESLVLLLGAIGFAAGMASYLRLSAIAVCFLVGAILANFPRQDTGDVTQVLSRLERPIYFLFLVIAGALWRPSDWRGWALMASFVAVRLLAKRIGAGLLAREGSYPTVERERDWLIYAPAGAIAIAIVINGQELFSGPRISWIVTAVIGGSVLSEALVQSVVRRRRAA